MWWGAIGVGKRLKKSTVLTVTEHTKHFVSYFKTWEDLGKQNAPLTLLFYSYFIFSWIFEQIILKSVSFQDNLTEEAQVNNAVLHIWDYNR